MTSTTPSPSEAPPVTGWQPIETAPKDGTVILVYADQGPRFSGGRFNGIHAATFDPVMGHGNGWGHGWIVAEYQNLGRGISGRVTHWMPLPAPPEDAC